MTAVDGIDRRALLRGGGVLAAGALGAAVGGVAMASPAAAAGLGYTPVAPFRSYDSRADPAGKIEFRQFFGLQLISDQSGTIVVPTTAQAVTYNLTVAQTGAGGFLGLVPGGTDPADFTVSSINWTGPNTVLANGGTVGVAADATSGVGSVVVFCDGAPGTDTHFIIDVTGYFAP